MIQSSFVMQGRLLLVELGDVLNVTDVKMPLPPGCVFG